MTELFHTETIPRFSICVQCGRCSGGCPVAFESEDTPRKIIRFLQWGWLEEAGRSPFLWLCASCQTCTTRCPRGVDIAGIMVALRRIGLEQGWVRPEDLSYYKAFIEEVKKRGKINELRLGLAIALHKMPPLHPVADAVLLFKLLLRGKLK